MRTPFPSYPKPYVDEKGQQQYKLGDEVFKSKKQIHEFLQFQVLKAIASFLNTKGGTLVIGVHEIGREKEVVGIAREGFPSTDHYIRHLIEILKNKFDAVTVSEYVEIEADFINGIEVCVVRCPQPTEELVFLEDNVYVRTGPRIDLLSTREVLVYQRRGLKISVII